MAVEVRLTHDPIELGALLTTAPADGAACLFVGVVRHENGGRAVLRLEYEAFEEMALPLLEEIARAACARWKVTDVRAVHRLGRLEIGEASVAVSVTAPHRGEAFAACRHVIDTLKATVPIWKREFYADGAVWLEGPGTCVPGEHDAGHADEGLEPGAQATASPLHSHRGHPATGQGRSAPGVRASPDFGIVVRMSSLEVRGISLSALCATMETSAPYDENDRLLSFGPHFGPEAADTLTKRLMAHGLRYPDDFCVAPDMPAWAVAFLAER